MKSAIYTFKKIGYILFFGYGWLLIALIFIISTNNRKYFLEILDKKSKGIPTTEEDFIPYSSSRFIFWGNDKNFLNFA